MSSAPSPNRANGRDRGNDIDPQASASAQARDKRVLGRPFQRGYDPRRNYAGRPIGVSLTEQINLLGHTAHEHGGRAWLKQISTDDAAPLPRRMAADILLRGRTVGFSKAGKPLAGDDIDRMFDRTVGKAPQQFIVQHQPAEKPTALADDLVALLEQQPELVDQVWPRLLRACNDQPLLRERLLPVLQKHHPDLAKALQPVATTAHVLPNAE